MAIPVRTELALAVPPAVWSGLAAVLLMTAPRPFDAKLVLNLVLALASLLVTATILILRNLQAKYERDRAEEERLAKLAAAAEIKALDEAIQAIRSRELADILAHQVELLQELRDRPRSTAA